MSGSSSEDRYRAGNVWLLKGYDFGKGAGPQDKFIVLMGDVVGAAKTFVSLTTSQERWYPAVAVQGSTPCGTPLKVECYRIDPKLEACFPKKTFVQFNNTALMNRAGLDAFVREGKAEWIQALDAVRFRSILKCALDSKDLPGWALTQMAATLKAMTPAKPAPKGAKPVGGIASHIMPELLPIYIEFKKRCADCRATFIELMDMSEADVTSVFNGSKPVPGTFSINAQAGLDLAATACDCTRK